MAVRVHTINTFPRRIVEINARLRLFSSRALRNHASHVVRIVVPATPVRTGLARGNWQVRINAATSVPGEIPNLDPTGGSVIAAGLARIRAAKLADSIAILNGADHIGALNRGRSPQAPDGFVEKSVRRAFALARVQNDVEIKRAL